MTVMMMHIFKTLALASRRGREYYTFPPPLLPVSSIIPLQDQGWPQFPKRERKNNSLASSRAPPLALHPLLSMRTCQLLPPLTRIQSPCGQVPERRPASVPLKSIATIPHPYALQSIQNFTSRSSLPSNGAKVKKKQVYPHQRSKV